MVVPKVCAQESFRAQYLCEPRGKLHRLHEYVHVQEQERGPELVERNRKVTSPTVWPDSSNPAQVGGKVLLRVLQDQ